MKPSILLTNKAAIRLFLIALAFFMSGCAFNIRTANVGDYSELAKLQMIEDAGTVISQLGAPQSVGVHVFGGRVFETLYYYGMEGRFSSSSATFSTMGQGFFSFDSEQAVQIIYLVPNPELDAVSLKPSGNLSKFAKLLENQSITVSEVKNLLGPPGYHGRITTPLAKNPRSAIFYDHSAASSNNTVKERFLLIGMDEQEKITDLLWIGSDNSTVKTIGELAATEFQVDGKNKNAELGKTIKAEAIEPLVYANTRTIGEFEAILGLPTSRGFKKFSGEEPLLLANWTHLQMEVIGSQPGKITPDKKYIAMTMDTERLMVAYRPDGTVAEIYWFRPIVPGESPIGAMAAQTNSSGSTTQNSILNSIGAEQRIATADFRKRVNEEYSFEFARRTTFQQCHQWADGISNDRLRSYLAAAAAGAAAGVFAGQYTGYSDGTLNDAASGALFYMQGEAVADVYTSIRFPDAPRSQGYETLLKDCMKENGFSLDDDFRVAEGWGLPAAERMRRYGPKSNLSLSKTKTDGACILSASYKNDSSVIVDPAIEIAIYDDQLNNVDLITVHYPPVFPGKSTVAKTEIPMSKCDFAELGYINSAYDSKSGKAISSITELQVGINY